MGRKVPSPSRSLHRNSALDRGKNGQGKKRKGKRRIQRKGENSSGLERKKIDESKTVIGKRRSCFFSLLGPIQGTQLPLLLDIHANSLNYNL